MLGIGDEINGTNSTFAVSDLSVPEGWQTIARQFIAGVESEKQQSPVGTIERSPLRVFLSSLRDSGQTGPRPPAMNCRAIVCRHLGTVTQKNLDYATLI